MIELTSFRQKEDDILYQFSVKINDRIQKR